MGGGAGGLQSGSRGWISRLDDGGVDGESLVEEIFQIADGGGGGDSVRRGGQIAAALGAIEGKNVADIEQRGRRNGGVDQSGEQGGGDGRGSAGGAERLAGKDGGAAGDGAAGIQIAL